MIKARIGIHMQKLGMCLFFDRLQDQQARLGILAQEQKI